MQKKRPTSWKLMAKIASQCSKAEKETTMQEKRLDFARKVFAHNMKCKGHEAKLDAEKIRKTNTQIREIECERWRYKMK